MTALLVAVFLGFWLAAMVVIGVHEVDQARQCDRYLQRMRSRS